MSIADQRPASRDSLARAEEKLDSDAGSLSAEELTTLGDELYAVLRVLESDRSLLRHLADSSVAEENRAGLATGLFQGKVGETTFGFLRDLVSSRWSRPSDLLTALERLGRLALLRVAESGSDLDDVEDELFRFSRVLDREPRLNSLLSDPAGPVDKRVELLRSVIGEKVRPTTLALLEQSVRSPRGRAIDQAANDLTEMAAARRDRYVAHVRTAVALTPDQEQHLTESLARLYDRRISLQVELDESLLGGLVVKVGGELIDGSVAGRLAAARRNLPG